MAARKASMTGTPDPSLAIAKVDANSIDLRSVRVAVIGGTDGLGRSLARLAAARGADVSVVGRTFRDEGAARLSFVRADLSSMDEAREVAARIDPATQVIVMTTGIMAAPTREVTAEGIERDMAISALSRVALLRALAPRLTESAKRPRVFVMGFPGAGTLGDPDDLDATRSYDAMTAHYNTVALNEALVLDARTRHPHLDVFGLNPGGVKTNIRANYLGPGSFKHKLAELMIGLLMPSAETYASRVLPLLVAPELEGRSGAMFGKNGTAILSTDGLDAPRVARFMTAADELISSATARARGARG
jgi:NAD(P)-dependent dehydrogenase (short-subunit alcohol dehydrogenase family)